MGLLKPILNAIVTIFILAWVFPTVSYGDYLTLIIAAVVLTILQRVVRPVLNLLFLPVNIVTLGLFSVVLNAALLWLAVYLVQGFTIEPTTILGFDLNLFFTILVISVVVGFLQGAIGMIL